jgi:hypothetical protein
VPATSAVLIAFFSSFLLRPLTVLMKQARQLVYTVKQSIYLDVYGLLFWSCWHVSAVSLPPGDVILAQLSCPLNDVIFCLQREQLTILSTNIGKQDMTISLNKQEYRKNSQTGANDIRLFLSYLHMYEACKKKYASRYQSCHSSLRVCGLG